MSIFDKSGIGRPRIFRRGNVPYFVLAAAVLMSFGLASVAPANAQTRSRDQSQNSGEQDLPVPDPGSMPSSQPNYMQQMNQGPDGPPDISGGNGQMFTRDRKF